jgi:hypothetical protein
LKIELDPNIRSIFNKAYGPNSPFPIECNQYGYNRHFSKESNRETDKAEGFADDSTAIVCPDRESVGSLENILVQFSEISGLQCNFGKSSITFINETPSDFSTKFMVTDSFTLLGAKIDKNLETIQDNFVDTRKKIIKNIYFWDRFELSLPGRICIAKTFLISQVNYLGSIILPNDDMLNDMQDMIDKFCTKGIKFAKNQLYLPPAEGGLGLINLKSLLLSQQSIWVKRASVSTRDNWRLDLWVSGSGNCLCPDPQILQDQGKIISTGIAKSFQIFARAYYSQDSNILDSFILNNPLLTTNNNFPFNLDTVFWSQNAMTNIYNISKLRIRDFLLDGKLKPMENLNAEFSINITANTYFRLSNVFWHIVRRFPLGKKSKSLAEFFAGFKKGSKQCRKVLQKIDSSGFDTVMESFLNINNLDKFSALHSACGICIAYQMGCGNLSLNFTTIGYLLIIEYQTILTFLVGAHFVTLLVTVWGLLTTKPSHIFSYLAHLLWLCIAE